TGDACCTHRRVIGMRVGRRIAAAYDLVLDLGRGNNGADADAAAEMLGDRDDVGNDAFRLEAKHLPELAKASLLFIDDQQHVALMAHLLERLQPSRGGSMTPPALKSGSVTTAAGCPVAWASRSSKLVFKQANWQLG